MDISFVILTIIIDYAIDAIITIIDWLNAKMNSPFFFVIRTDRNNLPSINHPY